MIALRSWQNQIRFRLLCSVFQYTLLNSLFAIDPGAIGSPRVGRDSKCLYTNLMTKLPKVKIFTDGSCEPNPGAGGWAALLIYPDNQIPLTGAEADTTNNRMELTAAVEALCALPERSEVLFYTDSEYLRRGITEWMPGWRARNWRRKGGTLANVDLWKALDRIIGKHEIKWHWVKAHATNKFNNQVDQLAREAMKRGR